MMIIFQKYFVRVVLVILISMLFLGLTVKYTTLEEITENSQLIVHGKIKSLHSAWENDNIYTFAMIEISDVIKGVEQNKQITIRQLGGTVGDMTQEISGTPVLWKDSEVFLFLVDWKGAYWINSIVLGYYEVVEVNGIKYAVNNFNDVEFIDSKTGQPIEDKEFVKANYELVSLKSQIRSLVSGSEVQK